MPLFSQPPPPRLVMSADGLALATYEFGDDDGAPAVLAVHGFASSAIANWLTTGWVRELVRAGFRVIAFDQRGHGASDKPIDPAMYTMATLCGDVVAVLDAYLLDQVDYLGYSLGARVGWLSARELPTRVRRAILGGISDGDPLARFRIDEARASVSGAAITDPTTRTYVTMAAGIPGNDLHALFSLIEGMRGGPAPDADDAPSQPLLLATGTDDAILPRSIALAEASPDARFFPIPGRDHFTAPAARPFRQRALQFLVTGA